MRYVLILLLLTLSTGLYAQDLFEKALSGTILEEASDKKTYELSGYMRGVLYGGKIPEKNGAELKSGYGETALKLKARKGSFGDGFAEIRYRRGSEFNQNVSEFNLREAYVTTYAGRFDFRIGHQIVVWGRADGLNPTDNITPKNMLVRSPNEDDRREGNFLIRSFFTLQPLRIEGIWVPAYSASVLPLHLVTLPPGVTLLEAEYPDANLKNSAFAIKINLETAAFDGSISFFNGYNPFPGVDLAAQGFLPKAYKMRYFGADFSTTLGATGLRGEFAYRKSHQDFVQNVYIPNPDLQYIIGGDREFGDLSIIFQYVGKYVFDYTELTTPQNILEISQYELAQKNRMLSSQLKKVSHSVSLRPAWKLNHETLHVEILGLFNLSTEEIFIKPKVTYNLADALTLSMGGEIYNGPDETLFGTIEETLSSFFVELKSSF